MHRVFRAVVVALLLSLVSLGCDKSDEKVAPAAPAMPAAWTVVLDQTFDHNQKEFLETEGRLKGSLAALRVTTYEVNGHRVQLNTLVPKSVDEGDKIFRILANKKKPSSYLRKDEILYEFLGPAEAEADIAAARELLAR